MTRVCTLFTCKLFCVLLFSSCLLSFCGSNYDDGTTRLRKETLIYKLDIVREKGTTFHLKSFVSIYYLNEGVLIAVPSYSDLVRDSLDKSGSVVGDVELKNDTTFRYFIYQKGNQTGISYDSLTIAKGKHFSVDSLLTQKMFKELSLDRFRDEMLVRKTIIKDTLFEARMPKVKRDMIDSDSTYCYFLRKPNKLVYSFSKLLDSANENEKLFRVRILFNAKFEPSMNVVVPKREFFLEIKEDTIRDRKLILSLFDKYSKDVNTSNK